MAQRYQNGHLRCAKRKRGPDVWEFLWREPEVDGKRRQRTLVVGTVKEFRTFREAQNQLHVLKANINADLPISSIATFEELSEHYCRTELLEENKTEKTRKTYQFYLRQWILPRWGGVYLHNMKTLHVEQWLRSLPGLANGSKAKIRNIMSAVFAHAKRWDILKENPIEGVRQSATRQHIPVILDARELQLLFGELALREKAMIICDAFTGMRRSELMGLKWKDVDFLRASILVTRSVVDQAVGNCKTEASRKPVVMGSYIAQALMTWRHESPYTDPEDWVWASPHKQGRQPLWLSTIMRYYIQPAAKRAGITKKIGWHTFRHTFATLVKYLNVEDRVVQEMMRHASPRLLDRYVQTLEGAKRQAQEQLVGSIVGPVQVMQA